MRGGAGKPGRCSFRQEKETNVRYAAESFREWGEREDGGKYAREFSDVISRILRPSGEGEHELFNEREFLLTPAEAEARVTFHLNEIMVTGEILRVGDKTPMSKPMASQALRRSATLLASIFRAAVGRGDAVKVEVESLQRDLASSRQYGEEVRGKNKELRRENDRLREECKRVKAEAQSLPFPATRRRSIGMQSGLPPMMKDRVSRPLRRKASVRVVALGPRTVLLSSSTLR